MFVRFECSYNSHSDDVQCPDVLSDTNENASQYVANGVCDDQKSRLPNLPNNSVNIPVPDLQTTLLHAANPQIVMLRVRRIELNRDGTFNITLEPADPSQENKPIEFYFPRFDNG